MDHITGIAGSATGRMEPFSRRGKESAPVEPGPARHGPSGGREADQVELSETARRAAASASGVGGAGEPPMRMELIERIRREIEAGTYETPEKIDAATDRIVRALNLEG